jgi:hypothetical protein
VHRERRGQCPWNLTVVSDRGSREVEHHQLDSIYQLTKSPTYQFTNPPIHSDR